MLDSDLKEQLKSVFLVLESEIALSYQPSVHADQGSLVEMLEEVASCSDKIKIQISAPADGRMALAPNFRILRNGVESGVSFRGIPGGHEFSSLILAILNADAKGKLPDLILQKRIMRLKGPIDLKTYISLSCENCPDVVQALNLMSLIHKNFKHEMIDGSYVPQELEAANIQGVPSVVLGQRLIHSGRISMLDLLAKLEQEFGTVPVDSDDVAADLGQFDMVVIGGGPAGASAAIYSVRKGLKTALLYDKIGGQVQETRGIENLISIPYTEGPQLSANLSKHIASYPIHLLENRRVKSISKDKNKKLLLESGETLSANAVIVATGAKWRELGVPGEKEYLGRGVAFCPHCDGPFYKGKKIAVIGGGNSGVEAAIDLAGLVRELVLFEFAETLKADKILVDKLKSLPNVSIITNAKTQQIIGNQEKVVALEYQNRATLKNERLDLDGIFVQIGLVPNSQFLQGLVELSKFGEVIVDGKGHTSESGIYAAGDVTTTPYKQIIIAMGEGAKAALAAFEDQLLKV